MRPMLRMCKTSHVLPFWMLVFLTYLLMLTFDLDTELSMPFGGCQALHAGCDIIQVTWSVKR